LSGFGPGFSNRFTDGSFGQRHYFNGHVVVKPIVSSVILRDSGTGADVGTATGEGYPTHDNPSTAILVNIHGTNFDDNTGDTVTVTAGPNITVGTVTVDSATLIHTTFTIAANTTSGPVDVRVGQDVYTSDINGNDHFIIGSFATLAPPTISLGLMSTSAPKTANASGTITTNDTTWAVTVNESTNTQNAGHMSVSGTGSGTVGTNVLTDEFQIKQSSGASYVAAHTGLSSGLNYPQSGTELPLFVSQAIESSDGAGVYQITITFTWSPAY
jgi:hypothetical protein